MENVTTYKPVEVDSRPVWLQPSRAGRGDKLMVHNSLTDRLEEFVPHEGNRVRWYTCGPTVYDVCHMGHARAYLTFDILRRIMSDYLHYDVEYHVNITDVDDKIILRARRNFLVKEYMKKNPSFAEVMSRSQATLTAEKLKLESKFEATRAELANPSIPGKRKAELEEQVKVLRQKIESLTKTETDITTRFSSTDTSKFTLEELIAVCSDPLGTSLDAELGATVCDNKVFEDHARKFEESFMVDMQRLGVRPPDVLTRVTEYVPKIVEYCEQLIKSGFAYESNGSVYLDTKAFEHANHTYRKLKPFSGETSKEEMEEGEGALAHCQESEKRDPSRDFALWKKSKDNTGEPGWTSPWGRGRPGWHIECSVVASDILGKTVDVHAGGEDLKFPHHDNELAQSEAYHNCQQWVNYFFHAGHLHIKGLKMSKSLKNFVTIEEALKYSSARRLRMLFLIQPWDGSFTYSDESLEEARSKEKRFSEFLGNVKALERDLIRVWLKRDINAPLPAERTFSALLTAKKAQAHQCILNNFDTPGCLQALSDIVDAFYVYKEEAKDGLAYPICIEAGRYVAKMLNVFGVDFSAGGEGDAASAEEAVTPLVEDIVAFREEIKGIAQSVNASAQPTEVKLRLLKACDKLRDETLVDRGVSLQDEGGKALWKFRDPKEMKAEIAEAKAKAQAELEAKKLKKVQDAEKKVKTLEETLQTGDGSTLFRGADKYSEWDPETGLPTKDNTGQPLSKNALKNMKSDKETALRKWKELSTAAQKDGFASPADYVQAKRDELIVLRSGGEVIKSKAPAQAPPGFFFTVKGERFKTMVEKLKDKQFKTVEEYISYLQ